MQVLFEAMKKRVLITSALPYINGVKHLGNLAGSMLPADVYARFQRQVLGDENVLFICATDEHGTPAELAAAAEHRPVRAYCDEWHGTQRQLCDRFSLSFNHFGRSSSDQNRRLTQHFAKTLWEAGFLEERVTKQVYSIDDDRFLADRYVVGTCPNCGYENARGDQCENCTRVLDPADLIRPRSALSGSTRIEIRDSKHLFLKQSLFESTLRAWIESKLEHWPALVTSIALKWLDEGLRDRGITRDLHWGIPLNVDEWGCNPDGRRADVEGLKGKVFYVWFDAPIEYISATWELADKLAAAEGRDRAEDVEWQKWWKGDAAADVTYVQFMGKDNVPFHTVGFPCTILGANERLPDDAKWKLVDELKGFNWLNYYGGKFSTSNKHGVFMDDALELLPSDFWRWYLVANAPEGSDSSFTWAHFQAVINKDLADVLGNFVNRILRFCSNTFGPEIPEGGEWRDAERQLAATLAQKVAAYTNFQQSIQLRKAAAELRSIWSLGNEYVDAAAPWKLHKLDRDQAAVSVRVGINLIRMFATLAAPIIPDTASHLLTALRLPTAPRWISSDIPAELQILRPKHAFDVPGVLFRKIEDSQISEWVMRFGGTK
jgi:methionyl-tRNA synthetase